MKAFRILFIALTTSLFMCNAAHAYISGYLEIPDVPGESKRVAVGNNETVTIGANQTETIKGGQAVVIGALWNDVDKPPARNVSGTVMIILSGEDLSDSLQRLQQEQREIPSMTLAVMENGKVRTYELRRAVIRIYRPADKSRASQPANHEAEIDFHSVSW